MRNKILMPIVIVLLFSMTSCASKDTVEVKNGYQSNGDGRVEWFELAPKDFIGKLNKKAAEKNYPELKELNETPSGMYSNDGETWYLTVKSRDDDLDPQEAKGKIYEIELSLFAHDEERAKMNGYYINTLIDMFNPGLSSKVTDSLYIYKEAPEDKDIGPVRQIDVGNVRYTYIASEKDIPKFSIEPAHIQVNSKSNVDPIESK